MHVFISSGMTWKARITHFCWVPEGDGCLTERQLLQLLELQAELATFVEGQHFYLKEWLCQTLTDYGFQFYVCGKLVSLTTSLIPSKDLATFLTRSAVIWMTFFDALWWKRSLFRNLHTSFQKSFFLKWPGYDVTCMDACGYACVDETHIKVHSKGKSVGWILR